MTRARRLAGLALGAVLAGCTIHVEIEHSPGVMLCAGWTSCGEAPAASAPAPAASGLLVERWHDRR